MMEKERLLNKNFMLLCLANLLMAIAFYFLLPTLPLYLMDVLKSSKSNVGFIMAAYTLATLLIRPFSGYFLDNFNRKYIYFFSMMLFSVMFYSYTLSILLSYFLVFRFLHGLTWGITTSAGATIVPEVIPVKRRGEGIGIFGLSMPVGMSLGPLLGLFVVRKYGYDELFISSLLIALTGTLLIVFTRTQNTQKRSRFSLKKLIHVRVLPVSLNALFMTLCYGSIVTFITIYAVEIQVKESGMFFLLLAVSIALTRFITGKVFDRKGPGLVTFMGNSLVVFGLICLSLWDQKTGFLLSAVFLGIGFGILMPVFQTMINNLADNTERGAANATFLTAFDVGIGIGSVLAGVLSDRIGLGNAYLVFVSFILLSFIWFSLYALPHYKRNTLV